MAEDESPAWPAHCCVPAMICDAAKQFGLFLEPRALAIELGVNIPAGDPNPWGLPLARGGAPAGVELHSVLARWPSFTPYRVHGIQLRHVPLSSLDVPVETWLADQVGLYVALGVDYAHYFGVHASPAAKHVLRLVRVRGRQAEVFDPSRPLLGNATWDMRRLEDSIEAIDDGFWLLDRRARRLTDGV